MTDLKELATKAVTDGLNQKLRGDELITKTLHSFLSSKYSAVQPDDLVRLGEIHEWFRHIPNAPYARDMYFLINLANKLNLENELLKKKNFELSRENMLNKTRAVLGIDRVGFAGDR